MKLQLLALRISKILFALSDHRLFYMLLRGIAPSSEHRLALSSLRRIPIHFIIDAGANKGQFALASMVILPDIPILSFEPLPNPFQKLLLAAKLVPKMLCFNEALGDYDGVCQIFIASSDDSSSLLRLSNLQTQIFGVIESDTSITAPITTIDNVISRLGLRSFGLLKIDVQGFELNVLKGCANLQNYFSAIYLEVSFVELYQDQPLAPDVISFLGQSGFSLRSVYNPYYNMSGELVQADFLFYRNNYT